MRTFTFVVQIEIPDDELFETGRQNELLTKLENVMQHENYEIYDSYVEKDSF